MQNKERKKELIEQNKTKEFSDMNYKLYKEGLNFKDDRDKALINHFGNNDFICLKQLQESKKKQKEKIKNCFDYYLRHNCGVYFCTFSISNKWKNKLENNKGDYLKQYKDYCTRVINESGALDYIINIDYGSKKEREHYHALIFYNGQNMPETMIEKKKGKEHIKIKYINENYKLGWFGCELANTQTDDINKLSNYIAKLINHSIKIKQSYISTKKDSLYNVYKALIKEYEKIKKDNDDITLHKNSYAVMKDQKFYKNFSDLKAKYYIMYTRVFERGLDGLESKIIQIEK